MLQTYHTEFLTGTIFNWEHLLTSDDFKSIIIGSFEWLVQNKKCAINAFVPIAIAIGKKTNGERMPDKNIFRHRRSPLGKTELHLFNPYQPHWNLATLPVEYKWSSARFYETGIENFFLA